MASIRLGDLLVKAKVITEAQLRVALGEQQKWGGRLGEILVRLRYVSEEMLVKALSKQLNIAAVNLDAVQDVPPAVKGKIPMEMARDLQALPLQLREEGRVLVVVMAEPQNLKHVDAVRSVSRCRIVTQIAGRSAITRAFSRIYGAAGESSDLENSSSFKVVDAQGNTVIRRSALLSREEAERRAEPAAPGGEQPGRVAAQLDGELPGSLAGTSPLEVLRVLEAAQRREVAVLKGMVELMIEKGVFTREEYLAKVRRSS